MTSLLTRLSMFNFNLPSRLTRRNKSIYTRQLLWFSMLYTLSLTSIASIGGSIRLLLVTV